MPVIPRNVLQRLKGHSGPVHTVVYSRGAGQYCISGGQDRSIRLWNPTRGIEVKKYEGHGYEVLSVYWSVETNLSTPFQ